MNLNNTTLVKNLLDKGELPTVNVEIDNKTIINFCVGIVIAFSIILIIQKLIK